MCSLAISADILRGHTDAIILAQLSSGDSYGYAINRRIQEQTEGAYGLKEATLYTAFRRMEQAGLISSYWGEDSPGARRRYYSITDKGRQQLDSSHREWQQTKQILDTLMDWKENETWTLSEQDF